MRVDTDVRLSPRLSRSIVVGRSASATRPRPHLSVQLDFFDEIFERRYFSAELETRLDPDGDHAFFMNFILYEY